MSWKFLEGKVSAFISGGASSGVTFWSEIREIFLRVSVARIRSRPLNYMCGRREEKLLHSYCFLFLYNFFFSVVQKVTFPDPCQLSPAAAAGNFSSSPLYTQAAFYIRGGEKLAVIPARRKVYILLLLRHYGKCFRRKFRPAPRAIFCNIRATRILKRSNVDLLSKKFEKF